MKIDIKGEKGQAERHHSSQHFAPTHEVMNSPASSNLHHSKNTSRNDIMAQKFLNWFIQGCAYLLAFLVPIFYLTNVPSILELNKQLIIVVIGGFAFLGWIGKLAWEGKIRIRKDFLLVPIIILGVIFSLSTVFSAYREQSMWGSFGTESLSLVTILAFIAFYFVITNNFNDRKKIISLIGVVLASSFLASLHAILHFFGINFPQSPLTDGTAFNTIGSVYALSAFMGAIVIIGISFFMEETPIYLKIGAIILTIAALVTLVAVNFIKVFILALVGLAVYLGLAIMAAKSEEKNRSLLLPMIVLTLILLSALIGQRRPAIRIAMPLEVGLSQEASLDVLKGSWKNDFLLGKGLSLYDLSYTQNKPVEINLSNFWTVKFNEASSRFLTLATSAGFLGAAAFLFLILSVLAYIYKSYVKLFGMNERGTNLLIGITAAWIYISLTYFFYPSNLAMDFLWWLLTASLVTLSGIVFQKKDDIITESSSPKVSLVLSFVFVLIIVGFISIIFLHAQKYVAAAAYQKAISTDNPGTNAEELVKKISNVTSIDPNRDLYFRNLSISLFAFLNQKVSEKSISELSDEEKAQISNIYFQAEAAAKSAVTLNPQNSDNLIQLAQVYQNVIGSKEGAEDDALAQYMQALKYDGNNPAIHYQIGQIYVAKANIEQAKAQQGTPASDKSAPKLSDKARENLTLAKQSFEKAVEFKGNYMPAQFMIAITLDGLGEVDQAIAKLEDSKKINPQDLGVLFQLGMLYYRGDQLEKARVEFELAIKLNDKYSNALYFLGLTLDKLGENNKALDNFKKVAELNPDNEDVKKIISNLEAGKKALAGLEQEVDTQQQPSAQSGEPSVQREQQPVPPETPIAAPEATEEVNPQQQPDSQPQPEENPVPQNPAP